MLKLESQVTVEGLTGKDITDFLLHPSDEGYQAWWPGAHLELHVLERGSGEGHVGDVVWMDERVGSRRVRMAAEVIEAFPGRRLIWQLRRWRLRLPVRLTLALRTEGDGVRVRHTITAGWSGRARLLDPLWRLYFSRSFASAMDRHVHTEFTLLAAHLHRVRPAAVNAEGMPDAHLRPHEGVAAVTADDRRPRAMRIMDELRDERGRRVMLVSHCLLNENTRYAGGATRAGAVAELVEELVDDGYGIHQLPCPERIAWGGVLKPHSLWLYHSRGGPLYPLRGALLRLFVWWTRIVYWRLARQVVRDVADYQRSGITVSGIVGIGTSPSCGVTTTVDLRASLDVLAACPAAALTREVMNEQAVLSCRRPGEGLFIQALDRRLRRRGIAVPAFEHDLASELHGGDLSLLARPAARSLGVKPVIGQ